MAIVYDFIIIGFFSFLAPVVYIIFKYATKEKTYDEIIAEQRKRLALEHNFKSKSKCPPQKKLQKNPVKERKNVDKKSKTSSSLGESKKESKKAEISPVSSYFVDKMNGNGVISKKKHEKLATKITSNVVSNKTNDEKEEIDHDYYNGGTNSSNNNNDNNNNINNDSGYYHDKVDGNLVSNNSVTNTDQEDGKILNSNNVTKDSQEINYSTFNENNNDVTENNNCENNYCSITNNNNNNNEILKDKISNNKNSKTGSCSSVNECKAEFTESQPQHKLKQHSTDTVPAKLNVQDKSRDKKLILKQEKEESNQKTAVKYVQKMDDKNKSVKIKVDEKFNKVEEKNKLIEEINKNEKVIKENKFNSPLKNKKLLENSNNNIDSITVAVSSSINDISEAFNEKELKNKPDFRKLEGEGIIENSLNHDQNLEKRNLIEIDNVSCKLEKSVQNNFSSKKQSGTNNSGGKISPTHNNNNKNRQPNSNKIKKQTNDSISFQKINHEVNGPINVNLLISLITKAELSQSEIQNIIDLLLKLQENSVIDTEWIERGRQDPVLKLKKQLAEKEKALCAEQEAHQTIQLKIKELRSELNLEKQNNRHLEETLNSRQEDLENLNSKLQSVVEEKQNLTSQLQQLQLKLKEERAMLHSLKEENTKTKNNLQQELLSQRQQLEMHIANLTEQHQQAIVTLESQLAQLANQLQEVEATNAQLNEDLRECVILRERVAVQDNQIVHLQQTASATQELVMQVEELRAIRAELDRHVASGQFEITRLGNELNSVTEQLNRKNNEIEKCNCTIQNMKIENQELLKQNSRINEQINFAFKEKHQLEVKNDELSNRVAELEKQLEKQEEINKMENELSSYKVLIDKKNTELMELNQQMTEIENSMEQCISRNTVLENENKTLKEIQNNYQKQIEKNEELRSKNWKVMEALSVTEKSLESKLKEIQSVSHSIKRNERNELLQRLHFISPAISRTFSNPSTIVEDEAWFNGLKKIVDEIRNRLEQHKQMSVIISDENNSNAPAENGDAPAFDELQKRNKELQSIVSHYKSVLADTEGILNRLQKHAEQEERGHRETYFL